MALPKSVGEEAAEVLVAKIKDKAHFELDISFDGESADIDGARISFEDADHPISSGAQQMVLSTNNIDTVGINLSTGQGLNRSLVIPQKAYVDKKIDIATDEDIANIINKIGILL